MAIYNINDLITCMFDRCMDIKENVMRKEMGFDNEDDFSEKAVPLLPEEWEWEHWPAVSEFIMDIVEHAEYFVTNAMRILQ